MIRDFARAVQTSLRQQIEDYTGDLANGQPATYDEYKRLCGLIQGLRLAEERLMDLAKKVETDDDDDS